MAYVIKIDDEYINGTVQQVQMELNGPQTAILVLPNDYTNRDLVASDQDVVITYLNTEIYTGTLKKIDYTQSHLICTTYDKVYDLMKKKRINESFSTDTTATIMTAIAATVTGVAAGVTQARSPTNETSVRFNNTVSYDATKFLAQTLETDFYSSGGDTINVGDRGSAKGSIPVLSSTKRVIDRYTQRTGVIIRGSDEDGNVLTGTAGDVSDTGDVAVFTEKKAQDQVTLDDLAQNKLTELNKESGGVNLQIMMVYAHNLYPGDTITVTDEKLKLDGSSYKIYRITKREEIADVEIDVAETLLERFLENQNNLEDMGIYSGDINAALDLDDPAGAPAAPTGVGVTNRTLGIEIDWNDNTEADLDYYDLYRAASDSFGASSKVTSIRSSRYVDRSVPAYDTYYFYWLKAADRVGQDSVYSASGATTPSGKAIYIQTGDLLDGLITDLKISATAVDFSNIKVDAIRGAVISAAAITNTKIAASAITSPKISAGAIVANKIAASAVTSAAIYAGAITTNKLDAQAVTADEIKTGTITALQIAGDTITANELKANSVDTSELVADSVDATIIDALAVDTAHLKADAVTAAKIDGNTITASEIFAGTITANEITLSGIDANGKLKLTSIGSGDLDDIANGGTYEKLRGSVISGGYLKIRTLPNAIGTYSESTYEGQHILCLNDDKVYFSDGTDWIDTGLTGGDVWGYGTRKLTAIYSSSNYQDISVGGGSSITPPAGRFIVAIWMTGASIRIQIYDYNSNWRTVNSPEASDITGTQTGPTMLNSPFYCDGSTVRLNSTDGDTETVRYWYFTEDT